MPKKLIEDMKVKRSSVYLNGTSKKNKPQKKKKTRPRKKKLKKVKKTRKIPRSPQVIKDRAYHLNGVILFIFILSLLLGTIFWGSTIFQKVDITIIQKEENLSINNIPIVADKGLNSKIPFEVMIISNNKTLNVVLSKKENVSKKAKGEITLYNKYSKKPEKIREGTYLSSEVGKVYLTDKAVSIPGYVKKGGKIIPGSVNVAITSFLPGAVYNGNPKNFYINSFKDTSKYKNIYGQTINALKGGAQGEYYSLSDENIKTIKSKINSTFQNEFLVKVASLIPKDYIYYPGSAKFSYTLNTDVLSENENTKISIPETLSVVIFKKNKLSDYLKNKLLPKIPPKELDTIKILNLGKLKFNFTDKHQVIDKNITTVSFKLTGKADLVWETDISKLKENLLGLSKNNIVSILKSYPGILNTRIHIFPPWSKTLPTKLKNINIDTENNID